MSPTTKTFLKGTAAVLGLVVVAGGSYMLSSNNTGFQANLIAQNPVEALPTVTVSQIAEGNANTNTAAAVSTIFDATPSADDAAAALAASGATMTGTVMTGSSMPETLLADNTSSETAEVLELVELRPAAAEQADSLLGALGFATNANVNTNAEVASAVTTTNVNSVTTNSNINMTNTTASDNSNVAAQMITPPRVPQTGAETWLLVASIVSAMMGMTFLLSNPKNI